MARNNVCAGAACVQTSFVYVHRAQILTAALFRMASPPSAYVIAKKNCGIKCKRGFEM